jgi:hypothetical protein
MWIQPQSLLLVDHVLHCLTAAAMQLEKVHTEAHTDAQTEASSKEISELVISLVAACEQPSATPENFADLVALCVHAFGLDEEEEEDEDEELPSTLPQLDPDPVTLPLTPEQRRCQAQFYDAHERTSHASVKVMKLIKKYNTIKGIDWKQIEFPNSEWKCDFCLRAKMARRPFLRKAPLRAQATRVAQRLSGDLLGKYPFSDTVMDLQHYLTVVCHYFS